MNLTMFHCYNLLLLISSCIHMSKAMIGMGFNNLDGWDGSGITHGRIWDMGVAWNNIHLGIDSYDWNALDVIVSKMKSNNMHITYVIGATPLWLAKYPNNPNYAPWLGPGSNSMPSDMDEANKFFWNLATRYAGQINAYEIWNEPQLQDFLYPYDEVETADLATLTKRAKSTIGSCDPSAKVLAASVLPRSSSGGMQKASLYLDAIKSIGWPIDAFTVHIYPNIGEGPDAFTAMLQDTITSLSTYSPPTMELWITETNYNIPNGPIISEDEANNYVSKTYDAANSMGIGMLYWYGWNTAPSIGGLNINIGTSAWEAIKMHDAGVDIKVSPVFNETVKYTPDIVGDTIISCSPYEADACNCVYYARDLQPDLPNGCGTCDDKKHVANSDTAKPGCVLFRTGDPTYCHAAFVYSVSPDTVFYQQSNWTPCKCSTDSLPINSDKIIGYWCP